jgi:hypothetical protein
MNRKASCYANPSYQNAKAGLPSTAHSQWFVSIPYPVAVTKPLPDCPIIPPPKCQCHAQMKGKNGLSRKAKQSKAKQRKLCNMPQKCTRCYADHAIQQQRRYVGEIVSKNSLDDEELCPVSERSRKMCLGQNIPSRPRPFHSSPRRG